MSDTSLSSLESEEEVIRREVIRRLRVFRDRNNPMDMYNEVDFKERFRFNKQSIREMLEIFGRNLERPSKRNKAISAVNQLLITLRFYATGSFQQILGDTFNVHKSTVCRIVKSVSHQIASLKRDYINMPTTIEEQRLVVNKFYSVSEFPGVIGAIDCSHVIVQSPGGQNAETFRNRKGVFSINVQAVCDASLKIRNIVARWPGSVHDSTIFNDSPLKVDLEIHTYGNYYLLGDNGYACKAYLLTPFLRPANGGERAYNKAHIATRNSVERCFGVLKRRFPCLKMGMRLKLDRVLCIIVACSVLHNIAILFNDEDFGVGDELEIEVLPVEGDHDTSVRTTVVNTFFAYR